VSPDQGFTIVRRATCAVGFAAITPEEFVANPRLHAVEVIGTGFVVGSGRRVLTCAHVITELVRAVKKRGRRPAYPVVEFVGPAPSVSGWMIVVRPMRVLESNDASDVAVLAVEGIPPELAPLPIVSEDYIPEVGEEIGVCGYAHGSVLLKKGKETARFGPLLQRGIVSALSPYDVPKPDVVLLDLIAGPAASGSPVFRVATGEIIGVLFEGQIKRSAAVSAARLVYVNRAGEFFSRMNAVRPIETNIF
jgi:S1-C subfamily serine protease